MRAGNRTAAHGLISATVVVPGFVGAPGILGVASNGRAFEDGEESHKKQAERGQAGADDTDIDLYIGPKGNFEELPCRVQRVGSKGDQRPQSEDRDDSDT